MAICLPVYVYSSTMYPPQNEPPYFQPYDYLNKRKLSVQCANCGGFGHVYKTCNHPIISYGIICYKLEYDSHSNSLCPKYLMVQRKDSLAYVEFIRGKYDLSNKEYITKMLQNMTPEERTKIHTQTFDQLWNSMWCRATHSPEENTKNFNKEFKEAKEKFDMLKRGYLITLTGGDKLYFNLDYIMQNTQPLFQDTEWGFPKGRRNINENDISCALREFKEETGIHPRNIRVNRNTKPLEEIFTGSNKVRYKHIYYIAKYVPEKDDDSAYLYDPDNKTQTKEVKDVQWYSYQDAQDRIRPCNVERKELFKRLNQLIIRSLQ